MLILTFIFDRQNAYTLFPKQGKCMVIYTGTPKWTKKKYNAQVVWTTLWYFYTAFLLF